MYTKHYNTARFFLGLILAYGFLLVIISVFIFIYSFQVREESEIFLIILFSGIAILASGLFFATVAQVCYAIIDQSDFSREMLGVIRQIATHQGVEIENSFKKYVHIGSGQNTPSRITQLNDDGSEVRDYMGRNIIKKDGKFYVDGIEFSTLGKAKAAIKGL